jgi:RecA/RadA recombinase
MTDKQIKHANPNRYAEEVQRALAEFEGALTNRYEEEIRESFGIPWNPDRENPTVGAPSTPDELMLRVPRWVKEIRADVAAEIPSYESQDLDVLTSAFSQLHRAASLLGNPEAIGTPSGIPDHVNHINSFSKWAGICGAAFRENFGLSTRPTMDNQCGIANSLINLYAARAVTIDSARQNILRSIRTATEMLSQRVSTDNSQVELWQWTGLSVAAIVVGIPNAPVGVAVSAAVVIGNAFDFYQTDSKYADDIYSIVTGVKDSLKRAKQDAINAGFDWSNKVKELQRAIAETDSKFLELYDITAGGSTSQPADGYAIEEIGEIEKLAQRCFSASDEYEQVISAVIAADEADPHLKGMDGAETVGDVELKDTRDAYVSFLQTTCARYYEAGCRLTDSARTYFDVETTNSEILIALAEHPDLNGAAPDNGGTVEQYIGATDRSNIQDQMR